MAPCHMFSEPVTQFGDGEYNLFAMKEIKVTESYLGLDKNIRECQPEEPFYNCTTRMYHDTFIEQCGCLPLNIITSNEEAICSPKQLECVVNVEISSSSSCMKSCSGLVIRNFFKSQEKKKLDNLFPVQRAYDKYKKITGFPLGFFGKNDI